MASQALSINFERLRQEILEFSEIGRAEDRGIYRMAFTDADMQARKWLMEHLREAGLDTEMDGAANVHGYYRHPDPRPSIIMGSHSDTVPAGGHLDGSLGVLIALECVRRLKELGVETGYNLEMVSFSDEEGRFGGLLGSQAMVGDLTLDYVLTAQDLDGVRLMDVMSSHGLDVMETLNCRRSPESVKAYLELHIEQGPVLHKMGIPAGIVEKITGLFKWSIRLMGNADHAGTTPMDMRKDAFLGLAEFAQEVPRVLEENGNENSRATIGKVELFPGSANTVPGRVEFSLDVRDTDAKVLEEMGAAFRKTLSAIARRRGLMFEFDILSEVAPVDCDPEVVKTIEQTAKKLGIPAHRMPSGAAHDAQIMSRLTPIGMIFVPSIDGRSHSSVEWTHWEDIESGANLALNTLVELGNS